MDYVAHLHGDHLDWLRGQRQPGARLRPGPVGGHDRARSTRRSGFADLLGREGDPRTSSTSGATTCRTTGRRGAPRSPTICRASCRWRERLHLIGLLLGTEEDWPRAFEDAASRRLGPDRARRRDARARPPSGSPTSRSTCAAAAPRARDRPARLVVRHPARVAEEGRADGRRLPAEQPVHVPGDGEALGLLRDDPARAEGAGDLDDPAQAARPTTRASSRRRRATTCRSTSTTSRRRSATRCT